MVLINTFNKYPQTPSSFSNIPGIVTLLFLVALFIGTALYDGTALPFGTQEFEFKYESMEKCKDSACYQFGLTLFLSFLAYVLYYMFCRQFPLLSFFSIFVLLGTSCCFVFTINKFDNLFEYLKYFSVFLGAVFISSSRLYAILNNTDTYKNNSVAQFLKNKVFSATTILSKDTWSWILFGALAINIAEATITDFSGGNYFNFVVGILLVLTMPRPGLTLFDSPSSKSTSWKDILYVNTKNKSYDVVYKTTLFWVLIYTSWDACFAYSERKEHFAIIVVVLLAALFGNIPNSLADVPYLYIQCRTYTLFMRYMILGYSDVYERFADSSNWYNEDVTRWWGITNLSLYIIYICYYILKWGGLKLKLT